MKLIRCYIENFGGLHQYTVDFAEGLTIIHAPNGFGKTTLAEFIRAMFYGFPRAGKDVGKNLRQKYAPWQGGPYGGYLIFTHEGKRYRIERSFGDSPKNDTFKLTNEDTHRDSCDFTANIGMELFGLDADSYIRSTYLPQLHDNGPLTTDTIRAKLGNLLEDTGDVGSYEKALQRLKDKRSTYEQLRGSKGSVNEAHRRISELQQQIAQCEAKVPTLERLTEELENAKQEQALSNDALQHIRSQLSHASTAEADAALSREYETLRREKSEAAQALDALTKRYPKGIPTPQSLEAAAERMDKYAAAQAQQSRLTTEENPQLSTLSAFFAAGIPEEEAIRRAEEQLSRAEALRSELPTPSTAPARAVPQKKFHSLFFPALTVAILAAAAGVYLLTVPLFDRHILIGGICGGLGLMGLIAAVLLQNKHSLLSKLEANSLVITEDHRSRMEEQARIAHALEAEVAAFLAPYPTPSNSSLRGRLAELTSNRLLYLHLHEHSQAQHTRLRETTAEMTELLRAHHAFCAAYDLTMPMGDRQALKNAERDAEALPRLQNKLTHAQAALSRFVARHGHRPAAEIPSDQSSLEGLKRRERELLFEHSDRSALILRLEQQCRLLRADIDRLPRLTDELRRQTERKAEDSERVRLLDCTVQFLQQARESLSTAYLRGVQDNFVRYLNRITGEQAEHIAVNSDLEVQLERMGSARPMSCFSAGQNDMVHLCMRLALSDALFEGNPCFMILDDPFVNLDDHHTPQMLALLKELAENRQIVYLVCNSSRI